jgi:hypothetical protein
MAENELSISWLINLLRSDGSIIVNKKLAYNIGLHEAIMYSELLSKYKYFAEKNELQPDGYFFNTVANMQKDTTLSDHQQRKAIRSLEKLGLIEYKTKGLPAKRYFKIVEDEATIKQYLMDNIEIKISKNLITSSEEIKELDLKKLQSNNTNINNTKINNTKVKGVNGIKFSEENIYSQLSHKRFENNLSKIDSILSSIPNYNKDDFRRVLIYYLVKYEEVFEINHPELKKEYWERVINDLFICPVNELFVGVTYYYYDCIDKHFVTRYADCDYNILHFATKGILENRFYEACY